MLQEILPTSEPHANIPADNEVRTVSDVLGHPTMGAAAKRALLASWASDRHAIPDFPGVRKLDNGSLVSLAEILQALRALDGPGEACSGYGPNAAGSLAERRRQQQTRYRLSTRWPHDDDPPPRSAAAGLPVSYRRTNAIGRLAGARI